MFKSTTLRAALALPVLSTLLIALSAGAMTAHATTVTSSDHYQKDISLSCSGGDCSGNFPAPGANHRLNVTWMNCFAEGPSGSVFAVGQIFLENASNTIVLREYLQGDSGSTGIHAFSQAVDMQVAARQHIFVRLILNSGSFEDGACTATGTLDTIQ